MNELRNRGLQDILIAVVDGLKGFSCHNIAQMTPPERRVWGLELRCSRGLVGGRHMDMTILGVAAFTFAVTLLSTIIRDGVVLF